MAVTGWQTAGTVVSVGTPAWTSATVAQLATSDNAYAFSIIPLGTTYTAELKCTNFGFSIPAGLTITGVELRIERHGSMVFLGVKDFKVKLLLTGSESGNDKASGTTWAISDAQVTYGGSTDTWGLGLSESDVENSGFGMVLVVSNNSVGVNGEIPQVDMVEMRVHYAAEVKRAGVRGGAALFGTTGTKGGFVT